MSDDDIVLSFAKFGIMPDLSGLPAAGIYFSLRRLDLPVAGTVLLVFTHFVLRLEFLAAASAILAIELLFNHRPSFHERNPPESDWFVKFDP